MQDNRRLGKRKSREQLSKKRIPFLRYYLIVTDAKETEQNYMQGLRASIPENLQGKLVINVSKTTTSKLVSEARNFASLNPQYGEPWIIFDRDQVKDFDSIIAEAKEKDINVGWSNPCIEIWFSAYFGTMPTYLDSVACCKGFGVEYTKASKQRYKKSDINIYDKLCSYGDEKQAINIAKQKLEEHIHNCKLEASEQVPATTVHQLVEEIKNKINKE